VSQEKVFGSNLSLVQDLIRSQLDDTQLDLWRDLVWEEMSERCVRKSWEEQILAKDIASFKAPSETPGHQEVMKRVCNHFVTATCVAMVMDGVPEYLKDICIGGCPQNEQEVLN
jgi:hypothetical protein